MPDVKPKAKGKKIGRNEKKCQHYRAAGRREKNKTRKAKKETRRQEKLALLRAKRLKAA